MKKRILFLFTMIAMVFAFAMPTAAANQSTTAASIGLPAIDQIALPTTSTVLDNSVGGIASGGDEPITKSEWINQLVITFEMTVEEDNYPDNYYSDLTTDHQYYKEIMIAVQFGVIDLPAGEALYPDAPATREFVAHTLNFCLGYQLEEGTEYTFNEAGSVTLE